MTIIDGHDAVLELGATPDDVSAVGTAVSIMERQADKVRSTFGTGYEQRKGGLKVLEFTFEGLVDDTEYGTIQGHAATAAGVAFELQIGATGGTSAGAYAGTCVITDLSAEANVDGDWTCRITAKSTGSYTFT